MKKDIKKILIILLILIVIVFINFFIELYNFNYYGYEEINDQISSYSFWYFSLNQKLGGGIKLLSPVIIIFTCVYSFYMENITGFMQNIITKISYKKYLLKNIWSCYKKALLLFPLFSIIVFLIATILFKSEISIENIILLYFPMDNPIQTVLLSLLGMVIFSLTVVNIGLILSKYLKKFYLVITASFFSIVLLMLLEDFAISRTFNMFFDTQQFYQINLWNCYFPDTRLPNWYIIIGFGFIRLLVSTYLLYRIYRNKESVVLMNE